MGEWKRKLSCSENTQKYELIFFLYDNYMDYVKIFFPCNIVQIHYVSS